MIDILLTVLGSVIAKLGDFGVNLGLDEYKKRRAPKRSAPRLARLDDVLDWGWSGQDLLKHLIALDRKLLAKEMGDEFTEEREGTVPQWAPVFTEHPDTWVLLTVGPKQIVGYWHFAALKEEQFKRLKSGDLLDSEITPETVEPLDIPGTYNLYFTLLGRLPEIPGGSGKLFEAFYDQMEKLADRGVFFREICANAMTTDGAKLCKGFEMKEIGPHNDYGTVYSLPMYPWPRRLKHKRWKEVALRYNEAFSEEFAAESRVPANSARPGDSTGD